MYEWCCNNNDHNDNEHVHEHFLCDWQEYFVEMFYSRIGCIVLISHLNGLLDVFQIVVFCWFDNHKENDNTYTRKWVGLLQFYLKLKFVHVAEDVQDNIFCSQFGNCMVYKGTASEIKNSYPVQYDNETVEILLQMLLVPTCDYILLYIRKYYWLEWDQLGM